MIRLRDFAPSDDVLNAIRSLRADDDGMEPLERDVQSFEEAAGGESPRNVPKAIGANYDRLTIGRYLRVKV